MSKNTEILESMDWRRNVCQSIVNWMDAGFSVEQVISKLQQCIDLCDQEIAIMEVKNMTA